ncbi:MAG: ORF6N domain-containing protein [Planctomycetes bacterium]|nr:ORF6N domain-containing protein [Planctomycetota bacterium]
MSKLVPVEIIANKIVELRGKKVMLDKDLSGLYGVPTKVLLQAVKRNKKRFPDDFMFQLNNAEFQNLRSQIVTSSWGGRRYLPFAFTEQGVAMLSSVLNSERAVLVNIQIMRAFVQLRGLIMTHKELVSRLDALERKYGEHDVKIKYIFEAMRQLLEPPAEPPKPRIGFHPHK